MPEKSSIKSIQNEQNTGQYSHTAPLLFTGSSIIQFWKTLEKDLSPLPVLNQGIAGATFREIRTRVPELIHRYAPSVIVLYAGSNDIQGKNPPDAEYILEEFKNCEKMVKKAGPSRSLVYLSIAPSVAASRVKHQGVVRKANAFIEEYCKEREGLLYHSMWAELTNDSHQPIPDYYQKDGIHFTRQAYIAIAPGIKRLLEEILKTLPL